MLKKLISFVLLLSFSLSIIPPAFASEITRTSILNLDGYKTQEELRQAIIGDEKWVENFPNGLFNFIGTQFQINENQEFLEIAVVRQGGTKGNVTVDFKAIDISAEYGKDYTIRVYENFQKNVININEEATPLIEAVGDNASINISQSIPDLEEPEQLELGQTEKPAENVEVSSGEKTAENVSTTPAGYTYLPESLVSVGEGSGRAITSLREAREAYLGEQSDRPDWKTIDQGKVEELKTQYDKFIYNMPGTETTLEFADGEYIKYLYVVPLNDEISESEEQIMFALERPSNGACRGEFYMSYVNLVDDEAPEASIFSIESVSVEARNGLATIVVKRTGGLQQYTSVMIGTEEGTAISSIDYEPGLKELFFTPGTSEQTVSVNVLDNPARYAERQFTIALDRTNNQVDKASAAALVTIPAVQKEQVLSENSFGEKQSVRLLSSAPTNINAEILSPYGSSPAKGKWLVTGEDFLKAGYTSDNAILPEMVGNGLFYDYTHNYSDQIIGYDFGSLGGINSIDLNYWNHGIGDGAGSYYYSILLNTSRFYKFAAISTKQINGYTNSTSYNMQIFKGNPNYVTQNNFFMSSRCLYYQRTRPVVSDITLNLIKYQTSILPAATIHQQAYKIENGKMSYQGIYKDIIPGELHIERIDSNVGNHQIAQPENNVLIDSTDVYRSDRIKFTYDYSDDNLHGKYAEFTGFEIKQGWDWVYFEGTELVLDAKFFSKNGVGDAVNQGKIEIRPAFAKKKATLEMEIDTQYGYLKNLANLDDKDTIYSIVTDPLAPQLYTGDVISGLELVSDVSSSKRPSWTSKTGPNAGLATSSNRFVITEKIYNSKADYFIEDAYNKLILGFKVILIIKANPNIYKDSVTMPSYKLDGIAYNNQDSFSTAVEKAYDEVGNLDVNKNPILEMGFEYVFDKGVPRVTDLGTPKYAIMKVYKKDGTVRKSYHIDPVAGSSSTYKFTCMPKEEGWQLDDFASLIIYGVNDNKITSTRELVIDFLDNSRDVITVTSPAGENRPLLSADIKTPLTIEDADPLGNYILQSINSPGFEVSWQDNSPDMNNDGQVSIAERDFQLKKLQKLYPDIKTLDGIYKNELYWNYFTYIPRYFDPSIIYYSFQPIISGTTTWDVEARLYEQYNTVLNPNFASRIDLIKNAEVYFGKKQVYDGDVNGVYKDRDNIYSQGRYYPAQLVYGKQVYNFAVEAGSSIDWTINTSKIMMPKDFHAVITKGSSSVDQNLGVTKTSLNIEDATTTVSYRIDGSGAGIKANNSIVRIYDANHNLFMERQTGAPTGGMFSLDLNTAQEGIGADYSMTIAGVYEQKDKDGNVTLFKEYPEVRVGLKFCRTITALSILAGFQPGIQPVVSLIGKLNNKYDLGMNVVIDDNDDSTLKNYTDKEGRDRNYKFITFGYSGTYEKKIEEKTKDTLENNDKGNADLLKEETEQVSEEDSLKTKVSEATPTKNEDNQPVTKKSGGGDFGMEYKISLALTWEKKKDADDGSFYSSHYFNSLVLMATATFPGYKKEHTYITPIGLPVTVTLKADGSATAILAFEADRDDDPYDDKYKLEDSNGNVQFKPQNYNIYSKFMVYPTVDLSAKTGQGNLTVTIGGSAEFDLVFDVPLKGDNVKSSGTGGVKISAYLKIKFLFVQKKWTLYSHDRIDLFGYGSTLQDSMLSALSNPYQNYLYEKVSPIGDEDIMTRDYLTNRETWNGTGGNQDQMLQADNTGVEQLLQKGVFPYPQTRLIPIDQNKTLMLFIEDDTTRDPRNRASLMYSILEDGNSTLPVALDNNGTWDEAPDAFKVGDRILVTWSDADKIYTQGDTENSILKAMNISGIWLDLKTGIFGEKFAITRTVAGSDHYADLNPEISYDANTQRLMVYYNKIDYDDRWTVSQNISDTSSITPDETPGPMYGDLVNGYSVIGYRYADYDAAKGEFVWNETYTPEESLDPVQFYGQRFLALAPLANITEVEHEITDETITVGEGENATQAVLTHAGTIQTVEAYQGLKDPRIVEMDLTTYSGKAVFAYIMDYESDLKTPHDQQLYVQTYNYATKMFSYPIEITNNNMQDTHPRFVQNGDAVYLYWLQDGDVVYTCISDLLNNDGKLKEVTAPDSGKQFYIIDKSNSAKEAHVLKAVDHNNRIDEFQISSKDGRMYILWTEDCISYKNGMKPGDPGIADTANQNKERQIFAASAVVENDHWKWSKAVKVTNSSGANYSDLSFIVPTDGQFLVASAKYSQHFDENAGHFTDSNEVRDLVVNYFTIASLLELGEITTDVEYPMPEANMEASVVLSNRGLKTYRNPYYQFYVDVDGTKYYESDWMSYQQNEAFNLMGGSDITLSGQFKMPDSLDNINEMKLGFRVKSETGELLTEKEKTIFIKPDLKINIMDSQLSGKDRAKLHLYVKNTGNKAFDDTFKIMVGDKVLYTKAMKLAVGEAMQTPLEIGLGGALFEQLQTAEDGSRFDLLTLNCIFGEFSASTDLKRKISSEAFAELEQVENFSVKYNGNLLQDNGRITMVQNSQSFLETVISKKDTASPSVGDGGIELLKVDWDSSNPSIAYVQQDGVVVLNTVGSTTITATLKPYSKKSIAYADGSYNIMDASYLIPEGVSRKISFIVDVISVSGGPSNSTKPSTEDEESDLKPISMSIPCVEKVEGDKLILTMNEKLFTEAVSKTTHTLMLSSIGGSGQIRQVAVSLTTDNIQSIVQSQVKRLTISSAIGSVTLNKKAIDAIAAEESGKGTVIELTKRDANIEVRIKVGDREIENLNGGSFLLTTYHKAKKEEDASSILVYDVNDETAPRLIKVSLYQPDTGEIIFRAYKPGRFVIGYNKISFSDNLGWAKEYINLLSSRNIVFGIAKSKFAKDKTLTRVEFVAMLARLTDNIQITDTATHFTDVAPNAWYMQYVKWAYENGIVNGTSASTFSPDKTITREEMAVMLKNYMTYAQIPLVNEKTHEFKDKDAFSPWSITAVNAMKAANIMNGIGDNKFGPKKLSSRAEATKVIAEVLKLLLK